MNRNTLIRCALTLVLLLAGSVRAQYALETDRPARRLQISVRFDDAFDASRRSIGASGRIGTDGSQVEIRARESTVRSEDRVDQTLQVLEGGHAMIYTGQSQPVRERRYIPTPAGVVPQEVTVVQDTRLGFDVVPRITGATAQVEIAGRVWIRVEPL